MRFQIRAIGGPLDGHTGNVSEDAVLGGCFIVVVCPRHGLHAECECDDSRWYGYFLKPEHETRFEVIGRKEEDATAHEHAESASGEGP